MSRKRKKKKSAEKPRCELPCIYFQENPTEIFSDEIIDGVRQRKVVRHCLFDNTPIRNWEHECSRGGKFVPLSENIGAKKEKK